MQPSLSIRSSFRGRLGWLPTYQSEAHVYAKYILSNKPDGKIAILYQNDDYGKDFLKGLKDGLGENAAKMIVIEERYEVSEPTIDSHIVTLKSSGADVLFDVTTPKFAAQVIKKMAEIGWKPLHVTRHCRRFHQHVAGSRSRKQQRSRLGELPDGLGRPAMEGQRRDEGVGRVHG